jgi:hypothetical protein
LAEKKVEEKKDEKKVEEKKDEATKRWRRRRMRKYLLTGTERC